MALSWLQSLHHPIKCQITFSPSFSIFHRINFAFILRNIPYCIEQMNGISYISIHVRRKMQKERKWFHLQISEFKPLPLQILTFEAYITGKRRRQAGRSEKVNLTFNLLRLHKVDKEAHEKVLTACNNSLLWSLDFLSLYSLTLSAVMTTDTIKAESEGESHKFKCQGQETLLINCIFYFHKLCTLYTNNSNNRTERNGKPAI